MKILFITAAGGIDYLADCVFHGLVSLGHNVIDSKYLWYLSQPLPDCRRASLYGKGFTLSGNLPCRDMLDRSCLRERITFRDFDLVVYGSVWRCLDYFDEVRKAYHREEIVFCDGEDHTNIKHDLLQYGVYFKRELLSDEALPISFAVPEEKMASVSNLIKTRETAFIYPGRRDTYIYSNEQDYYKGYRESMFGVTFKKAGWDCLRHYEIIMNACLPYFIGFENIPRHIMTNWPRKLQADVNRMCLLRNYVGYNQLLQEFFGYCKTHFQTKNLASYVLSKCGR